MMSHRHSVGVCVAVVAITLCQLVSAREPQTEVHQLLQTTTSWDGVGYDHYPAGQPQITVLRILIPANTSLAWHYHPVISAAYLVSGTLYLEKRANGEQKTFHAGEALTEMMGSAHRGFTKAEPVELIVFYAGTTGLPITVIQK